MSLTLFLLAPFEVDTMAILECGARHAPAPPRPPTNRQTSLDLGRGGGGRGGGGGVGGGRLAWPQHPAQMLVISDQ